jgi:hypothetical protein
MNQRGLLRKLADNAWRIDEHMHSSIFSQLRINGAKQLAALQQAQASPHATTAAAAASDTLHTFSRAAAQHTALQSCRKLNSAKHAICCTEASGIAIN